MVNLLQGDGAEIPKHLRVLALPQVLLQGHGKEEGIIRQPGVICGGFRFCEQTGTDPAVRETGSTKEVETASHKIQIAETGVVCQGLETEVPHPQSLIPLRPVLEDILHAFCQGQQCGPVNPLQQGMCQGGGADRTPVCAGFRRAGEGLQEKAVLRGGVQNFQFHKTEGTAAGQVQPGREHIHPQLLLLNPAPGNPALIGLGLFLRFPPDFRHPQPEKGGGIRMAAGGGQSRTEPSHQVGAKVQADPITPSQGQLGQFRQRDGLLSLRPPEEGPDRFHLAVLQDGSARLCLLQQFRAVAHLMQFHIASS